ncbi:putative membrane protein ArfC [Arthrobacter sp. SO5]|nr:putative membrane protein ArfC [Arthrobacter sp. SO5]
MHHSEYTEPHAPTLPGAESAAAEAEAEAGVMADTRGTPASSPAAETAAGPAAGPAGHLALDQPYGEGSAAPAADGSGPAGFTVKGIADSMTYYDETNPGFEATRAEVWFESSAYAEAAGFRLPRRSRQF